MMRVSRNDIYWNKFSIRCACENIDNFSTLSQYIEQGVALKVSILEIINKYKSRLEDDIDRMESLYNNKVIPYENMDDTYKTKAFYLYDKYSNLCKRLAATVIEIADDTLDLKEGIFNSAVALFKGVLGLAVGVLTYAGAGIGIACEKIFGDAPDFLNDCIGDAGEYNKSIYAILEDPFIVVEGLSQNINDAYEEKGIAYCTGYVVGEIIQLILLKKLKAARISKEAETAGETTKTV